MADENPVIRRLTFASFQADAKPTGRVSPNPLWPALALGGEAGELLNVRKKIERDEPDRKRVQPGSVPQNDLDFLEEAGDVLFYLQLALLERGFTMEDAAARCLEKLKEKHHKRLRPGVKVVIIGHAFAVGFVGREAIIEDPPNSEDIVHVKVGDHLGVRFYANELKVADDGAAEG